MKNKLRKVINCTTITLSYKLIEQGEHLQSLAEQGLRNYDWIQGHIGDIGGGAGIMAATCLFTDTDLSKKEKFIVGMITPTIFSLEELIHPQGDWQDIACYIGGALLAWAIPHTKEIITDTKKYFKSKTPDKYLLYTHNT